MGHMRDPVSAQPGPCRQTSTGSPVFGEALLSRTARDFLGASATDRDLGLRSNQVAFAGRSLRLGWETAQQVTDRWSVTAAISGGYFRFSHTNIRNY